MKTRLLVFIVVAICVAGFLVGAFLVPVLPRSQPFNLSRTLPTGTTYFNGQIGCGPNETVRVSFPANGAISYWITQNATDASVNIWGNSISVSVSPLGENMGSSSFFLNTGSPGSSHGSMSSGEYTFVFQACGSAPTVSLGFWGVTNYSAPLL